MTIRVIMFGKQGKGPAVELFNDYAGRLRHYTKLELLYWPDHDDPDRVDKAQEKRIASILSPRATLVVLDDNGTMFTSVALAKKVQAVQNSGSQYLDLIVGGAYGIPQVLKERSQLQLSLSKMTLPHQLARTVLMEQVYRAHTILKGERYHH